MSVRVRFQWYNRNPAASYVENYEYATLEIIPRIGEMIELQTVARRVSDVTHVISNQFGADIQYVRIDLED